MVATSSPTGSEGKTSIRLIFEPDDAGKTYTYVLKEVNGGSTIDGVKYDDAEFKINISVVDNYDGTVSAYVYDWTPAATDKTEATLCCGSC